MYVLNLRRLGDPLGLPESVAHSDSAEGLERFVAEQRITPVVDHVDGMAVVRVFRADGPLGEYAEPVRPKEGEQPLEGIIDYGTINDRVDFMLKTVRPQIEAQVREAWQSLIQNTIKV